MAASHDYSQGSQVVQSYADALLNRTLRFEPAMEAEFAAYHTAVSRARVRFWQTLMLVLAIGYLMARLVLAKPQVYSLELFMRLGVLIPAWAILAAIAWSRSYERWYMPVARILVPVTVCAFAMIATMRMSEGRQDVLATLTTMLLGTLFLSGLLFRHAMMNGVLMLAVFFVTALLMKMSMITLGYSSVSALTALAVGAFVYYDMELINRRAFLRQSIADTKAHNDVLTGLANRRAFDEQVPRAWLQAARESKTMAILMVDVDHFKKYNDRYGHQSGDRCLAAVGKVVNTFARRPLDFAARLGGEEMAVLLFDVEADLAHEMAQNLRKTVQELAIEHLDSTTAKVITVSIGVAVAHPSVKRSAAGLLQLADEALYQAKQRGRNQVALKHEQDYDAMQTGVFRLPGS
jgi:diguanylate cyclase (GGDEF)-like protein